MSGGAEVAYVGLGPLVGRRVAQPGTPYDGRAEIDGLIVIDKGG